MRERRERVNGPYRRANGYRVYVSFPDGTRESHLLPTEAAAIEFIVTFRRNAETRTVDDAIDAYIADGRSRGLKDSTLTTYEFRLHGLLGPVLFEQLGAITARRAASLYKARAAKKRTDTHRNELITATTFAEWCIKRGWIGTNPFAAVEPTGIRARRKPQLREDEARQFLDLALDEGTEAGLAVAMALLMGLRASEVTDRIVRDVDAGATRLWIDVAKSRAGERRLEIPEVLQSRLRELVTGRDPAEQLFRGRDRHWLLRNTVRLTKAAKVPRVTPHGLRGTAASVAATALDINVVAAALGHASAAVTRGHYAEPAAERIGQQRARLVALAGGRK